MILDPDQQKKLEEAAAQEGLGVEEFTKRLIDEALAQRPANGTPPCGESLYEALTRTGSLGCVKDGPTDLASNPKHMEGFGRGRG